MNDDTLRHLTGRFGIDYRRSRPDLDPPGSPERTLWRHVVESENGSLWILEGIVEKMRARKQAIAQQLESLAEKRLDKVSPYRRSLDGRFLIPSENGFVQIAPFIEGVPLKRPSYVFDAWRGEAVARFMIKLRDKAPVSPAGLREDPFSLPRYVRGIVRDTQSRDPEVWPAIRPVFEHLEQYFFAVHDQLPFQFSHGDIHAVNIIWGPRDIRAVIDWEFCGMKVSPYDAANFIGCVGFEDPEALVGPLTATFFHTLGMADYFTPMEMNWFFPVLLAIRFAWMSEWLRKKDHEMARLETDYFRLLMDHETTLRAFWEKQIL